MRDEITLEKYDLIEIDWGPTSRAQVIEDFNDSTQALKDQIKKLE